MSDFRVVPMRRKLATGLLLAAMLLWALGQQSSVADVTQVTGSAYGYYVDNSLFGGPSMLRGFGQQTCASPNDPVGCVPPDQAEGTASPSVTLPSSGGDESATDADGAAAVYGPATIFGGIWPADVAAAPPSGPITVSTEGTTGPSGSVTSAASIDLHPTPVPVRCVDDPEGTTNCTAPGGIGPGPLIADEVRSTCTATEDGTTPSVTFVNGIVETKYDAVTQLPTESEPIPENPDPGYTVEGTIDHVGDSFRIVFNEQVENADGSLTVHAAHLYLLGPTAVGDAVFASSTCGVTAAAAPGGTGATTTTSAQSGGATTSSTQPRGTNEPGATTTTTARAGGSGTGGGTADPADPTTAEPRFTG